MRSTMTRKQVGMIDDALLARVDARAAELGQTRRVFTERALEAALAPDGSECRQFATDYVKAHFPSPPARNATAAARQAKLNADRGKKR